MKVKPLKYANELAEKMKADGLEENEEALGNASMYRIIAECFHEDEEVSVTTLERLKISFENLSQVMLRNFIKMLEDNQKTNE